MDYYLLVCHSCKTWMTLALNSETKGILPDEVNGELLKAKLCAFISLHSCCQIKYERHGFGYDGFPVSLNNYKEFTESEKYKLLAIKKSEEWFVNIIEGSKK